MLVRQDLCEKCSGGLDWHHDPMDDSGKCENCGEVWFPMDSADMGL